MLSMGINCFLYEKQYLFNKVKICSDAFDCPIFGLSFFFQVFVCLVVILTSSILVIAYIVLLPLILNTYSPAWIAWHICYGHWNLIMIAFHYYKAAKTSPGYPPTVSSQNLLLCRTTSLTVLPFFCSLKMHNTFSFSQEKNDRPFVSVCKKCIMPKPARTHHCGICNR